MLNDAPLPEETRVVKTLDDLSTLLDDCDQVVLSQLILESDAEPLRRAFSNLNLEQREKMVNVVEAEAAAVLVERLAQAQAVELLEGLPAVKAASIIRNLSSDLAGDLLREMGEGESDEILGYFEDAEESDDLRERANYEWDTAGGLMADNAVAFPDSETVGTVLEMLTTHAEDYSDRDVQYVYAVDAADVLKGVLPLRTLVLTPKRTPIREIMIKDPVSVRVDVEAKALLNIFEQSPFLGLPVVDSEGKLEGIVSREAVQEAMSDQQTDDFLKTSGIVGGEELRSMPLRLRCTRRLAWLIPNIILNLIAASVIAFFEDTLQAVIALAIFLPIVSDMSGCSGNQAVAVSIRELTLGIIRSSDFLRVMFKEAALGLINGSVLGTVLGTIAGVWQGNVYIGLVIGVALALNTVLSVLLGGLVPLFLKRMRADPALASGPILTTCTDMCGFFLVLGLATVALERLVA